MQKLMIVLFVMTALTAGATYGGNEEEKSLITPAGVRNLIKSDSSVVLLDVRTPPEFNGETGHLARAHLIPVQELEARVAELSKFKKHTIVVYCRTGHRSTAATEILLKHGFKALNMVGGITRWRAESLPVVVEHPQEKK